jgi:hypothetical protein
MVEIHTAGVDTGFVALGYTNVAVVSVVQGITECCRSLNGPQCVWLGRSRLCLFRGHAACSASGGIKFAVWQVID